jgi:hypothetical protein
MGERFMADRKRLNYIGWLLAAVTATVIVISGVVVNTGVPQAATYDVDMATR